MTLITGNLHKDERGTIRFVNNFKMTSVKRMYCIEPKVRFIRAWQGHKKETKWFYVAKGRFLIKTVDMLNFNKKEYILNDSESVILEIKGGHYNGFEALQEGSVLLVFSDFDIKETKDDDYRESIDNIKW